MSELSQSFSGNSTHSDEGVFEMEEGDTNMEQNIEPMSEVTQEVTQEPTEEDVVSSQVEGVITGKKKRKASSKPPSDKQLTARRNFTILARARNNYMKDHVGEDGKRHRPPKGWQPTAEEMSTAEQQLISEGKLN